MCGVVNTSSVGMLGLQVMPFFAGSDPPSHRWPSARPTRRSVPGPRKCSAWNRSPFRSAVRACSAALCPAQAATGSGWSTRDAAKIASHSRATASASGRSGNMRRAQAGEA